MSKKVSGDAIRRHLLRTLHIHESSVISKTAKRFGIPRPQVEKHAEQLVSEGKLKRLGKFYNLVGSEHRFHNPIAERDREDEVYRSSIEPHLLSLPDNVRRICYYGFTEIYNNAVDHSGGSKVSVSLIISEYSLSIRILDDGIGVFDKIKNAFGLTDTRQALTELARGGVTTDPERHSGQGIFFASRAFDTFYILANDSFFAHSCVEDRDWLIANRKNEKGTLVKMSISKTSKLSLKDLFDKFTVDKDELTVFKTHAPLRLSSLAEGDFVSRSQAKRVLARFEKYEEVFLDFEGVDFVGQAFADEIFRVFPAMHPHISLVYVNENDTVRSMIEFAKRTVPIGPNEGRTSAF